MSRIPTRRERRAAMKYQGVLKMKSKLPFSKWAEFTNESSKNVKQFLPAYQYYLEKSITEALESKELVMIEQWKEFGYTAEEIKKLREAYATLTVRDLSTWHSDKKIARNLIKEVNKSRVNRIHG